MDRRHILPQQISFIIYSEKLPETVNNFQAKPHFFVFMWNYDNAPLLALPFFKISCVIFFHAVISEQQIILYYNKCINNAIYTFKSNEFFHGNFYQDLRKQIGIYHTIFLPWLAFVLRVNKIPNKMKVKAQKFTGNDLRFISSIE